MAAAWLYGVGLFARALAAPAGVQDSSVPSFAQSSPAESVPSLSSDSSNPRETVDLQRPPLLPAAHWDAPRGDLQNLAPQSTHDLYFSSDGIGDPTLRHTFASLTASWTKDVVILDQTSWIENVTCLDGDVSIEFAGKRGYDFAKSTWQDNTEFLLATYTNGCGADPQTRSFYQINDLTYFDGAWMILANVKEELGMESILDGASLQWGDWEPEESPASDSAPSSKRRSSKQCGAAPSATIDGFPAVACNDPDFDDDLDDLIGYFDCDGDDFSTCFQDFVPGLEGTGNYTDAASDDPEAMAGGPSRAKMLRRRELVRRRLQRRGFLETVGKFFTGIGKTVGGALSGNKELIKEGQDSFKDGLRDIKITPEVKLDIPIDIKAPADKLLQQPWPNSVSIAKKTATTKREVTGSIEAFCVECHAKGKVKINGKAEWNAADGVKKLEAGIKGEFQAQIAIGLVAEVAVKENIEQEIARLTVPGFAIPKIIEVGPFIALRATAEIGVELKGRVLAGAKMTIPPFEGTVDLIDASKSKPLELKPEFEKIFEADAQLTATAGISLPVAVGLGISIPPAKGFKKDLEIVEKPTIMGTMKAEISTTGQTSSACKGIDWHIKFINKVYVNALDIKQFDLHTLEKPLASGCLSVPGVGGSSSTILQGSSTASSGVSTVTSSTVASTSAVSSSAETTQADTAASTTPAASTSAAATEPTTTAAESTTSPVETTAAPSDTTSGAEAIPTVLKRSPVLPHFRRQDNGTASANSTDFSFVTDEKNDFEQEEFDSYLAHAFDSTDGDLADGDDPWERGNEAIDIFSPDKSMRLTLDASGNIRPIAANYMGSQWIEKDGLIYADQSGRVLHYYPDVMQEYGVSRIRAAWDEDTPQTADIIFLGASPTSDESIHLFGPRPTRMPRPSVW